MKLTTIFASLAAAVALVATPGVAEAGGASSALRGAMLRRAAAESAERAALAARPRDVVISRSRYPGAAANIEHAQRNGQPTILHVDRAGAAKRRAASTGGVSLKNRPAPGYERDEYPPAMTREGGGGANVRFIPAHDNRGAGSSMRAQTRDVPDGSRVRILVGE